MTMTPTSEQPRLSRPRAVVAGFVALIVLAGAGFGLYRFVQTLESPAGGTLPPSSLYFAPYVDLTLPPTYNFQDPTKNPSKNVVLGFVVGGGTTGCTPKWGDAYTMDQAALRLDLDRRIVRLRQSGGQVIGSFGGAINRELAVSCSNPVALAQAYSSIVARYQLTTLDFDIEGSSLNNIPASLRRATAVATVQATQRAHGKPLNVWLTLPVTPQGLLPNATATIHQFLDAHVDLTGVNIMTMNYGGSRPASVSVAQASINAITATAQQLRSIYRVSGHTLTLPQVYAKIGVTPMIGQNSVLAERLTIEGATQLYNKTVELGVGRFSMWSLNRDFPCGGNANRVIASNWCSGVVQSQLQFSNLFATRAKRLPSVASNSDGQLLGWSDAATKDKAPYEPWRQLREYIAGAKVVWNGEIYLAKWWNVGDVPDAPVDHEWNSPWIVLGPVLPVEATTTTLPPGAAPEWVSTTSYGYGQRVERHGIVYRSSWLNKGYDPATNPDNTWLSPWTPVTPESGSDYPSDRP